MKKYKITVTDDDKNKELKEVSLEFSPTDIMNIKGVGLDPFTYLISKVNELIDSQK